MIIRVVEDPLSTPDKIQCIYEGCADVFARDLHDGNVSEAVDMLKHGSALGSDFVFCRTEAGRHFFIERVRQ